MRRHAVVVLVAFVGVVLSGLPGRAMAADAAPATAADAVALVNQARGGHDLVLRGDLSAVAQRHADRMVAEDRLFHNPTLATDVAGYELVGENVGVGPALADIEDGFMASPTHRANILESRYTEIGIGLATSADGALWVVQVFRQPYVAPAPAPAPKPAPVAKPSPAPKVAPVVQPVPQPAPQPAPVPVPAPDPAPVAVTPSADEVAAAVAEGFVWPAPAPILVTAPISVPMDGAPASDVPLAAIAAIAALALVVRRLLSAQAIALGAPSRNPWP